MDYQLSTKNVNVLEFAVYDSDLDQLDYDRKIMINTINQYSYVMSEKDSDFREALMESDVLLPDGIGIVLASKWLSGHKIKKIAGSDLHKHLLEKLNKEYGKCFYLGSSNFILEKIKQHITLEYPNVRMESYSPPFKNSFSEFDNQQMIHAVNSSNPDVLFIGMTAPKQEKWAYHHKEELNVNIICSIGAVFDFYAGTIQRPNKFWINLGLEWFIRLVREPRRMWERYLYYGPKFALLLLNKKFRQTNKPKTDLLPRKKTIA